MKRRPSVVSTRSYTTFQTDSEGVEITLPLMEEPWGEKLFQTQDPNGVVIQLVEWVTSAGGAQWTG